MQNMKEKNSLTVYDFISLYAIVIYISFTRILFKLHKKIHYYITDVHVV